MSHHKHHMKMKHKKHGGATSGRDDYSGSGEPDVVKDAKEKKHGGSVHVGHVHGHKGKHRIKKARGGGVGSDKSPFTSASSGEGKSVMHGKGGSSGGFQAAHGK